MATIDTSVSVIDTEDGDFDEYEYDNLGKVFIDVDNPTPADLAYIRAALAEAEAEANDPNTVYYTFEDLLGIIREKYGHDILQD
ncbi:MAG: hypothetical protein LBC70_09350 [Chitinispirillales bacterium]|jgi:hypothetical protein|nr:hypothetical protein [Chitinispirillales bacterium]